MKWVRLNGYHINTDLLTTFFWRPSGELVLYHVNKAVSLPDPDRELYIKLCRALGVRPMEEVADGKV